MTTNSPVSHRPYGIEHPYAVSPDQRVPVLPEVGGTTTLGVQAEPSVEAIVCEWRSRASGSEPRLLALAPVATSASDASALAGGEGHLAEAQAAAVGGDGGWAVESPALEDLAGYMYRFTATLADGRTETTGWFEVAPVQWTSDLPSGMSASLDGAKERLVDESVQWLVSADGIHRARFALALGAGDHVVGFGERYDWLDQAGHRLDAVVFEQYKSQGAHGRTYLPMPFAHVVGADGDGWGFHVRTSRRTWFDCGASEPDRIGIEVALGGTPSE